MALPKGVSGNPSGRPKYSGEFTERLRRILLIADSKTRQTNMDKIAHELVKKAKGGDLVAIGMCFDRIDGKAAQPVTGEGGQGPVLIRVVSGVPRDDDSEDH